MVVFVLSQTDRAHRASKGLEHQLVKAVGFTSVPLQPQFHTLHFSLIWASAVNVIQESSKAFQQSFLPLW